MSYDDILFVLKKVVTEGMSLEDDLEITPDVSLRELGANSIDRADILMQKMSELQIKVPMMEFATASNIGDIVTILVSASSSK